MAGLYKFKVCSNDNIEDLINDRLFVATLSLMNDPMDLGFYVKNKKLSDERIKQFQVELNKAFVVISFSREILNRRLWNYYTDGMKGMYLAYRKDDLISALKRSGADKLIAKKVTYGDKKKDLSKEMMDFLELGKIPPLEDNSVLFHKDISWKDEKEYRIIAGSSFLKTGSHVDNVQSTKITSIRPYQIGIGYKIAEDKLKIITKYAFSHNIPVRKYTPDFRNQSSRAFVSESIVGGEKHIVEYLTDDYYENGKDEIPESDITLDEFLEFM